VSILTYAALTCALAMSGGFVWNAVLSAVGRLFTYGAVCLALLRLRQCRPDADAYRVTAGPVFAAVGLLFCVALVTQMRRAELVMVASIATLALAHWRWVTRVRTRTPRGQA